MLLPVGALACLLPWISPGLALVAGSAMGLAWGNPFARTTRKVAQKLQQMGIVQKAWVLKGGFGAWQAGQ